MSRIRGPKVLCLRRRGFAVLIVFALLSVACGSAAKLEEHEAEALSRTEFTDRIENFFEYSPLKAGEPSEFLIHLTDLSDGSPVEKAEVTLDITKHSGRERTQVKAKVGRVTGIYVAEVALSTKGTYDIEFHIKNEKLDERLPLKDFEVE